ncbi:MAG: 2'-deoxycytidine 5'-triphosphate deaminase, partial [Hyphomicrobiales bacterium]|nr:2'-deoxycytidine 5'-triphosphate deaminase [Hyphomicrobiales bacterium]
MALASQKTHAEPTTAAGGILPSQAIARLIDDGSLMLAHAAIEGQIQPASLDLRLGAKAYRVRASFLPGPDVPVEAKLKALALHEIDLSEGAVLEVGCVYLVPLLESLSLPSDLSAACNPKSSTGRLDVFTRVITDECSVFDKIEPGYRGPLYAEICPQTFPVLVRTGSRLSQIRFRAGRADAMPEHGAGNPYPGDGNVSLSVDLAGDADTGFVGYRAKRHTGVVDVDKPGALDVLDFWEPIHARGRTQLILDPDQFYILASKEAVTVLPTQAAEMVPFNPLVGEFRVHYAGFFDPGFGYSQAGGEGSKAVLEVRSHKVPFILEDGQIIGQLIYEPLTEPPEQVYGQDIGSHYQAQGL